MKAPLFWLYTHQLKWLRALKRAQRSLLLRHFHWLKLDIFFHLIYSCALFIFPTKTFSQNTFLPLTWQLLRTHELAPLRTLRQQDYVVVFRSKVVKHKKAITKHMSRQWAVIWKSCDCIRFTLMFITFSTRELCLAMRASSIFRKMKMRRNSSATWAQIN